MVKWASAPARPGLTLMTAAAFALGAGALGLTLLERHRLQDELAVMQRLVAEASDRHAQLAGAAEGIRRDATEYAGLLGSGLAAPHLHQDWNGALQDLAARLQLDEFDASIGNPRPVSAQSPGTPVLMATQLRLRLRPRHEPQLLAVIDAIVGKASGPVVVAHGCELRRVAEDARPALEALCEFDRLAIHAPEGSPP